MLPLATLLFLVALLHPRLRHFLVVTLCFFVCFCLLRERYRLDQMELPDMLRYDVVESVRPLIIWSIAGLAALAGVGETLRPGTEWARRCYFGAATLFFVGLGVFDYGWNRSARSIVLCLTGVVALSLCIFAHRLGTDLEDDVAVRTYRRSGLSGITRQGTPVHIARTRMAGT